MLVKDGNYSVISDNKDNKDKKDEKPPIDDENRGSEDVDFEDSPKKMEGIPKVGQ